MSNPGEIRTNTHGGPNRGQGRKPSGYIIRNVRMAFKDEAEYKHFLKHSSTRTRVAAVLRAIDKLLDLTKQKDYTTNA